MLSDIERKVLRIIANYEAGRRRTPTIQELCIKTGRSQTGIRQVLGVLQKEGYIKVGRGKGIELIERWERRNGWLEW